MVSQASINQKVSYGFAKAAIALGANCGWFRAQDATAPITRANQVGMIMAAFRIPNSDYTTPSNYSKPFWWGMFYATMVQRGDYLVDPNLGTFFVASIEPIHYPLCISTNAVVTVTRPMPAPPGANHYGGGAKTDEAVLATGWPASLLNGGKGEKDDVLLPGATRDPWAAVLLPPSFPVQILTNDVLTTADVVPRRYTVSAAELTGLGWRITAALATP